MVTDANDSFRRLRNVSMVAAIVCCALLVLMLLGVPLVGELVLAGLVVHFIVQAFQAHRESSKQRLNFADMKINLDGLIKRDVQ